MYTKKYMVKKVTQYKDTLRLLQEFIPQAALNRSRGHETHIRATNITSEQYELFKNNSHYFIEGINHDTRYSTSYNTVFLTHNNDFIPCILSYGELKKNKNDSLVQKQLTPNKLAVLGEYNDLEFLLNKVQSSLENINPQLNSVWASSDSKEFTNLLIKLCYQVVDYNQSLTPREKELLKAHKSSLGKDFGEILAAIHILNIYGNVTISLSESNANFDLSYLDDDGIINKFNTKSGNGSGQSFKSIKNEFLSLDENDYKKGTSAHICLEMIKSLCEYNNIKGRDRIFNMAKYAQKLKINDPLGAILQEISIVFFNAKTIEKQNYNAPVDFNEYSNKIKNIWNRLSLKEIGLPIGSNEEKPDIFYSTNENGKENAILFTLATFIAHYFNDKIITNIMQKLLKTKIYIIHVGFNNDGVYFNTPTKVTYKFHYWGNYKNPTNNLPGFKAIYDK